MHIGIAILIIGILFFIISQVTAKGEYTILSHPFHVLSSIYIIFLNRSSGFYFFLEKNFGGHLRAASI